MAMSHRGNHDITPASCSAAIFFLRDAASVAHVARRVVLTRQTMRGFSRSLAERCVWAGRPSPIPLAAPLAAVETPRVSDVSIDSAPRRFQSCETLPTQYENSCASYELRKRSGKHPPRSAGTQRRVGILASATIERVWGKSKAPCTTWIQVPGRRLRLVMRSKETTVRYPEAPQNSRLAVFGPSHRPVERNPIAGDSRAPKAL